MAKSNRLVLVGVIVLLCWFAAACGGNSSKPAATGMQFVLPAAAPTVEVSTPPQTVALTVNQPANWSFQPGAACRTPLGTLSATQGTAITYTAPVANTVGNCGGPLLVAVVATSTADPSQSAVMVITVVTTPPSLTPTSLGFFSACPPSGTLIPPLDAISANTAVAQVGTYFSATIGNSGYNSIPPAPGGVAPYTWNLTGSLPAGLSMSAGTSSSSVVISGTPTTPGCSAATTFTLQVTDAVGVTSAPVTYTLVVIPPSLKVQNPTLPSAYNVSSDPAAAGVPYSPAVFTASGGTAPYTWVAYNPQNNFPLPGLNLAQPSAGSNVAIVSGAPAAGSSGPLGLAYTNQIQVNDSQAPYPAMYISNQIVTNNLILPQFCSQANGGEIFPSGSNGGTLGGNSVAADAYLQGSFAFLLRGFDASGGPVAIAGSATFDGAGNVTGGEEDLTNSSGHQLLTIQPGSVYVIGTASPGLGSATVANSRGCMSLSLKDSVGSLSTTNFAFTLAGCSNQYTENAATSTADNACGMTQNGSLNVAAGQFTIGRILEFDCAPGATCTPTLNARASGILRMQDSTSFAGGLNGPYAFGMSGQDVSAGRYAIAGSFQAGSGNLSSIAADTDDAGTIGTQLTGGSGSYSSADSSGRLTGSVSIGSTALDVAGYVVGKNSMLLVTTDTLGAGHPILGGEAISSGTAFNNTALENTHMFHLGGITSGSSDVSIGLLSFDGIGAFTGTEYEDQGGTLGTAALSGAYTIDSTTGRALLATPSQGQNLGAHPFVAYVIPVASNLTNQSCSMPEACITGFLVGTDSTAQDGMLEFQTPTVGPPPPFNSSFVAGDFAFGTDEPLVPGSPAVDGSAYAGVTANSSTNGVLGSTGVGGSHPILQDVAFGDSNYCLQTGCYLLLPSEALAGAYSVATNGTGTFGNGKISVTNGREVFYIDESSTTMNAGSVVLDPHPTIVVAEQ